jgi:hypothetical protein
MDAEEGLDSQGGNIEDAATVEADNRSGSKFRDRSRSPENLTPPISSPIRQSQLEREWLADVFSTEQEKDVENAVTAETDQIEPNDDTAWDVFTEDPQNPIPSTIFSENVREIPRREGLNTPIGLQADELKTTGQGPEVGVAELDNVAWTPLSEGLLASTPSTVTGQLPQIHPQLTPWNVRTLIPSFPHGVSTPMNFTPPYLPYGPPIPHQHALAYPFGAMIPGPPVNINQLDPWNMTAYNSTHTNYSVSTVGGSVVNSQSFHTVMGNPEFQASFPYPDNLPEDQN